MKGKLHPIDHPWVVNAFCVLLTAMHAFVTLFGWVPNIWGPFLVADAASQSGVYLGFLSAAAIVSGFAGVVVVFGLSGESVKFREFRLAGGESLARNWISAISSSLLAGALALGASLALFSGGERLAPWLLELGILLIIHSSVRLLFLMRGLIGIVSAEDVVKDRAAKKKRVADAPFMRRAG